MVARFGNVVARVSWAAQAFRTLVWENFIMASSPILSTPHSEQEIQEFFARLEREYPDLIEAMKVLNVSYQQYLAVLEAMTQARTVSSNSAKLML